MSQNNAERTPEQEELMQSRLESSAEEYGKLVELCNNVIGDSESRLPFVPSFYRTMKQEAEEQFLRTTIPKVEEARTQQFCMEACKKQGPDCLSACSQFTGRAFSLGNLLYANLHKTYTYTDLVMEKEDDE